MYHTGEFLLGYPPMNCVSVTMYTYPVNGGFGFPNRLEQSDFSCRGVDVEVVGWLPLSSDWIGHNVIGGLK